MYGLPFAFIGRNGEERSCKYTGKILTFANKMISNMDSSQLVFDYKTAAKDMLIPYEVMLCLEKEVQQEFPDDPMLGELHILRALKNYATKNEKIRQ
jgi:hypothetical protein